jgi:cardiolipin synthase (CMP-forming)
MTLANRITILRIVLVPVLVIGLLQGAEVWPAILFIFSAFTDVMDGAAARWRQERTTLGSYLDPLADKLLLVSTFLVLAHRQMIPMWVFVVIFSRDLLIFIGWNIIYILTQNSKPAPRLLGKLSTFCQMAAIATILVGPLRPVHPVFLWIMIAVTAASAVDYVWVGAKRLHQLG